MENGSLRPWGRYEVLDRGDGFQVKRIIIDPGRRFSYQRHARRSEHWILVQGQARVTLDDEVSDRESGEHIFVPLGAKHRMENIGGVPLIFVEVQQGSYLGEDDIERLADDFGRSSVR